MKKLLMGFTLMASMSSFAHEINCKNIDMERKKMMIQKLASEVNVFARTVLESSVRYHQIDCYETETEVILKRVYRFTRYTRWDYCPNNRVIVSKVIDKKSEVFDYDLKTLSSGECESKSFW